MPSLTAQERRDLALTIAGEIDPRLTPYGTPESAQEIAAILGTIENRYALGYFRHGSRSDVVKAPKQYSTWNDAEGRRVARDNYDAYKEHIDRAVNEYADGYLKSPAPGATHYWAPRAMQALTGSPDPYWARDIAVRAPVGAHIFGAYAGTPERLAHAYDWMRSPPVPTTNPATLEGIGVPPDWAHYAASRISAPKEPVGDGRSVAEMQQDRLTMGLGGILGLDGRLAEPEIAAAPIGPAERTLPPPAHRANIFPSGTMASPLPAAPVSPVTRGPLPAPQGVPIDRPSRELGAMRPTTAKASDADLDQLSAAYAQLAAARMAGLLMQMVPAAAPKATPAAPVTPRLIRKEPVRVTNPISVGRPGSGLGGGLSGGAGGLGGGSTGGGMGGLGQNYGGL
jgi:hypothetical protein